MARAARAAAAGLAATLVLVACSGGDDDAGPTTTEPEPVPYVALGDSFSAGEGAPPYDEASGACHRSELAWPGVLDRRERSLVSLELRACGGATTSRLLGPWESRGEPAQIPTAPDPEVGLVTLTIGGNDVGFGEVVVRCVLLDCSTVPDSPDFTNALAGLSETLVERVYPALRVAYPNARIVHVGYPHLTPETGRLVDCGWLSGSERDATVALVDALDAAIAMATEATEDGADVDYADVRAAFEGHELCTEAPWVHPVLSLASERAHPTIEGHAALAEAVADALGL